MPESKDNVYEKKAQALYRKFSELVKHYANPHKQRVYVGMPQ